MPKVPVYTPQSGAAVPGYARVPGLPQNYGLEQTEQGLYGVSGQLASISERINATQDDVELAKAGGLYDAGVRVIADDVLKDPDRDPLSAFVERTNALQEELAGGITRDPAKRAFAAHVAKKMPAQLVDLKFDVEKIRTSRQLADLESVGDTMSKSAALAPDAATRDSHIRQFGALLERAEGRNVILPAKRQDMMKAFTDKVLRQSMDHLARTNRPELYRRNLEGDFDQVDVIQRMKILEFARTAEEHEQAQGEKIFKKTQQQIEDHWNGLANQGALAQADLDEALKNGNPYITPSKARELQKINDNPPVAGESSLQIRTIMEEYHAGSRTLDRVKSARASLLHLRTQMPGPNTLLDKALNELQNDEASAEAAIRSEQATQAAMLAAGMKAAEDLMDKDQELVLPGLLGQWAKAATKADKARVRNLMRGGMTSQQAVDYVKKEREKATQAVPDKNKKVLDLAR